MGALPEAAAAALPRGRELPDYLPARMVNEFVYCPRLFFYEWVDGVFRESADTIEGSIQHARVDSGKGELPRAGEQEEKIHARSVTLSSERLRVIAKLDLIDAEGSVAIPVDYKHGRPREVDGALELWPPDKVQIALQALILRDNGYVCEEGVVFYQRTRQRVRVEVDEALEQEAMAAVEAAWECARRGELPAPLVDSPKCAGCSLNGICLPDETNSLGATEAEQLSLFDAAEPATRKPAATVRRLIVPRDELKPVYLNTPGLRVGKSGSVLQVKDKDTLVQEVRLGEICQLNLMGNIQLSTQAIQALCEEEIPICYFSMGGWFYGMTHGLNQKNVFLRQKQFRMADTEWFPLVLARSLVAAKSRNQRVMLQRNHIEPAAQDLAALKQMAEDAERANDLGQMLGVEGNSARVYFGAFAGMLKGDDADGGTPEGFQFEFDGRNRRPPRDAVNALLSLAYSMLAKDLTIACYAVGFDPFVGFYHQPRFGRPALALDLMEPFRPLIADSAVLSAINTRMVTKKDFVQAGNSVALTPSGRKGFIRAYELRMDTLVTHPIFGYRMSYRRLLEVQARLLARVLEGEIGSYPAFVTR